MNVIKMLSSKIDKFRIHRSAIFKLPEVEHLVADISNTVDEFSHEVLLIIKPILERVPVIRNKN